MGPVEGMPSPDEAFSLLGDRTRLAILRAVWESGGESVPFSEIRDRLGNPDSGRFNYHLDKLRGPYLARGEEGYRLTQPGLEVVRAVLAGSITERPGLGRSPIDATCGHCGVALVVRYDGHVHIDCGDCGDTVMWNEFPPAGLADRTPMECARAFDRWTRHRFRLAMDGVCPNCAADTVASVADPGPDSTIAVDYRCTHCRYEARVPLFGLVAHHPAVVSFYDAMDVDVTGTPYWRLRSLAGDFSEEVVSEDPWSAAVEIEAEGRSLSLTLDEQFEVVEVDSTDR